MSKSLPNVLKKFISLKKTALLPGYFEWFSVVQSLDLCEDLLVSFDEVSKFVKEAGAFKSGDVFPPGSVERLAGGCNSDIDVLLGSLSLITQGR